MLPTLFGDDTRKTAHYLVFHDESEPIANKGWLLIGLLFVKAERLRNIEDTLNYHRRFRFFELPLPRRNLPRAEREGTAAVRRIPHPAAGAGGVGTVICFSDSVVIQSLEIHTGGQACSHGCWKRLT